MTDRTSMTSLTVAEGRAAINADAPLMALFVEILTGLPDGVKPYGGDFAVKDVAYGGKRVLAGYFTVDGRRYRITLDPIVRKR